MLYTSLPFAFRLEATNVLLPITNTHTHQALQSSSTKCEYRFHNFITSSFPSLLLLGRDGTLLLHTLATRKLSSHLFNLAVAIGSRVTVLGCGFHGVNAALLVADAALLPCCVAGYVADDAL
jgi:hypothetical protein